jgi:hypothetical protein
MAITETYSATITPNDLSLPSPAFTAEVDQDDAINANEAAHRVAALAALDDGSYTLTVIRGLTASNYDLYVYEDGTRYYLKGN